MSLPLARMRAQTSMAATAKRWPGQRAPSLTRPMAEVESTDTVSVATLLSLVEGTEGLVDGEGFRVEDLLFGS